jgi:hypothetical protein
VAQILRLIQLLLLEAVEEGHIPTTTGLVKMVALEEVAQVLLLLGLLAYLRQLLLQSKVMLAAGAYLMAVAAAVELVVLGPMVVVQLAVLVALELLHLSLDHL